MNTAQRRRDQTTADHADHTDMKTRVNSRIRAHPRYLWLKPPQDHLIRTNCRAMGRRDLPIRSLIVALAIFGRMASAQGQQNDGVTLVKDGVAEMRILTGGVKEPAVELQHYLKEISGADFKVEPARAGAIGIYVGRAADFP